MLCAFFTSSSVVLAHESVQSGTISGLLYLDPHGGVVAKSPAVVHVEFTDSTNKFTLATCDCTFTLKDDGQAIGAYQSKDTSVQITDNKITFPFTFAHPGDYTLDIVATPSATAQFEPFTLHYKDITVVEEGSNGSAFAHFRHHFWHYLILGGGIVVGFVYALWPSKKHLAISENQNTTQ